MRFWGVAVGALTLMTVVYLGVLWLIHVWWGGR